MVETLAPKARRARSIMLATVLATLALLGLALGAGRAQASQVGPITLEACVPLEGGGCTRGTSSRVDQRPGAIPSFFVTSPIGFGGSLFVELPAGASFTSVPDVQLNYGLAGYSVQGESLANENRRLQIPVPNFLIQQEGSLNSSKEVELLIGASAEQMILPPTPGSFAVQVWTTSDVDARTSSAITTTLGLPAQLSLTNGPIIAQVGGGDFVPTPSVKLSDSRGNGLPGEDVTFHLPQLGPGGSFAGSLLEATVETNAGGLASPPAFTADTEAGTWQVSLTGPESTVGSFAVTNLPGEADKIELEVEPTALMADGSSEAEATIWVRDQYDNPITTDEIGLESEVDGPAAGAPALQIDGSYKATLLASTVPGEYTVTATDTSVDPELTDSVTVVQDVLPATGISLALSPPSILADGSSTTTALIEIENMIGNPVAGEDVAVSSSGGNAIGKVVDHGDGTYSAVITSTTAAGPVTITATDTSTEGLKALAVLTQTALPPPPPPPPVAAPSVKITSGPKGKMRAKKATFKFVTTSGSAAHFECKLDKGKWTRCKSPRRYAVKPGPHTFSVRGVASDGSAGPVAKRSFKRLPPK